MHLIASTVPGVVAQNVFLLGKFKKGGYNAVKRWNKGLNHMLASTILAPVHVYNNHWVLMILDIEQQQLIYMDSQYKLPQEQPQWLLSWWADEVEQRTGKRMEAEEWKVVVLENQPRQLPDYAYDCGVFTCAYAKQYCTTKNYMYSQNDMPAMRAFICEELQNRALKFYFDLILFYFCLSAFVIFEPLIIG